MTEEPGGLQSTKSGTWLSDYHFHFHIYIYEPEFSSYLCLPLIIEIQRS